MKSAKKHTAIKALAALLLAGACSLALAGQVAGTVINLSGPLMAKKADGAVKVLAARSEVEQGDTLVAEKNTYAQIRFVDNSEITLKPNTVFVVNAFAYDAGKPEGDSASFTLVKGGLRSVTGLLGKRNKEKFQLRTPTATIGIRGTTFVAQYVGTAPVKPGVPGAPTLPGLAPGLHVVVMDGMIVMSNGGGSQLFSAGQFGYVPSNLVPPVIVPANPGLKFTPPPTFIQILAPGNVNTVKPTEVECEVR
ncbi:MAG: FecR family protein [Pseudomonadota bacterium]